MKLAGKCPHCGAATAAGAEYCPACGTHLTEPVCSSCRTTNRIGATYCSRCGTTLATPRDTARTPPGAARQPGGRGGGLRRSWKWPIIAAAGVLGTIAVAAGVIFLAGGDGDGERAALAFPEPAPIDRELVTGLQAIADTMPEPRGESDRDQIESIMGPPDAFTITFEQDEGGKSQQIVRYETWYYFELRSAFEFVDGDLLSNMPVDDVDPLAILPRQYQPGMFRRDMTWEDVKRLVAEPDSFARMDMPEAYGLKVWAYYGEQLMVAFDEEGLALVETYPLEPGGGQ